ncbi:MAG: glycosyltransferase, partial [Candidatus Limnocylindrales bacterium]
MTAKSIPASVIPASVLPASVAPTVAIVMPAYNEAARIAETLESIGAFQAGNGRTIPVYLADDGS